MATIKRKSFDKVITPTGGKAKWCKINSQVDEYEGKRRYTVTVTFEDKAKEKKLKDFLDDLIAKAKEDSEFAGCKKWRSENDRCGYTTSDEGEVQFRFQTGAFVIDRDTGEEKRVYVPVLNAKTKEMVSHDTKIGNGSEIRIQFTPTVYWLNATSNGINLYISRIVVDNLIEYQGESDFSDFGIEVAKDMDDMEVPI